ncbi:desiccation protectant protein Lea14 homolog [Impatiens glandulifera]|uniref:desiccation protectant protein Lea14 homolog n=1 Tax=Impatiens glandulifera TaxID=253017 RepID=UPI001FB0FBE1|nr:desiccation protectant protein Lea14 homolog [Impatiens glandulifera]
MADLFDKAKNFVADKVAHIKKPEATITDVDLKGVSRDGITYTAMVSVDNPYSRSIPICEISYTLKSANRVIASGTVPDPGSLAGNEKTMLNVPLKVAHSILVSLVKDIGADWDIDYLLEIGLIVDLPIIGNFTIPISTTGEIKLPTLSDLWKKNEE